MSDWPNKLNLPASFGTTTIDLNSKLSSYANSSPTDGQLLIGKTSSGTLELGTLTGTANQIIVTNAAAAITLSLPQNIHTAAALQHARLGLGAAADATSLLFASGATPRFDFVDSTASAKSLRLDIVSNKANFYEKAGAAGDILSLDLTNKRVGIGTNSPNALLHVKVGSVVLSGAALATNATDGFTYIPTCAGTPTGVPTVQTGTVAIVYDTTNNKIAIYNGAWKQTSALT